MIDVLYVDAGCRRNPGPYEVQGKNYGGDILFYKKFTRGSNNIGEYLAVYYGLQISVEVWTDSKIALSWIKNGCNTRVPTDQFTKDEVQKADRYFKITPGIKNRVKFWNTHIYGENPADFGRKRKVFKNTTI